MSDLSPTDPFFSLAKQLSPSPATAEKKQYWRGQRDSLCNRYKVGKPGSKRYIRWQGEYNLRKFLSDTESSLSESDPDFDKDFDESYEPSAGIFGEYFDEHGEVTIEILPFLDITEEEQLIFINNMKQQEESIRKNRAKNRSVISVKTIFKNLPHRNRSFLRHHQGTSLLFKMDSQLFEFLNSEQETLEIMNSDSYERLMIHSICKFYNLNSHSKIKKGEKLVVIKKKLKNIKHESGVYLESLSSFLESVSQKAEFSEDSDNEDFSSNDEEEEEDQTHDGLYILSDC